MELTIRRGSRATFAELETWRYEPPYERAGFVEVGRHVRQFERWGDVEFVDMRSVGGFSRRNSGAAKRTGGGRRSVRIRVWRTSSSCPTWGRA